MAWIRPAGWQACVDAVASLGDADVELLHIVGDEIEAASAARAGLLGRHRPPPHEHLLERLGDDAARALLADAEARLGRPAAQRIAQGRPERVLVEAASEADVLVLARDGAGQPGPRSLGPPTRFAVDHASCRVLLVWP